MKTSMQWWQEVKASELRLNDWLKDQYYGEYMAAKRIDEFAVKNEDTEYYKTLTLIALQERKHAEWVRGLLVARGISPELTEKVGRYWNETLVEDAGFETTCGIASHAENMRLERIRVICEDEGAPADIRRVFKAILKDEEFHAKAFTQMAGKKAVEQTREAHERGLVALGLVV